MSGDFARITFDPDRHFSQVLIQQGRLLLEADFNEQGAIVQHHLRTLITDLVGRGWRAGDAFLLGVPTLKDDFTISAGHFYVDGLLCVNGGCTFRTQPHGPVPDPQGLSVDGFVGYIECWERHVGAAQVVDLREIALNGRDTALRLQVVWQVRVLSADAIKGLKTALDGALAARLAASAAGDKAAVNDAIRRLDTAAAALTTTLGLAAPADCASARDFLDALDVASPRMTAIARRDAKNLDPCAIAADSVYRGRENQLYRFEIHRGGAAGTATFKWSRENGSVVFRVADRIDAAVVTVGDGEVTVELETLGHDRRTGLCEGDWVELTSDAFEFAGTAPPLGQVTTIDRRRRMVTLKVDAGTDDLAACTLVRRWDQTDDLNATGTIDVIEGTGDNGWIAIERGIQVQFVPGGLYRTGQSWNAPARVASGDLLWARDRAGRPRSMPPDGGVPHRAPIGFGKKAGGAWTFAPCGCTMKPLCA